MSKKWTIEDARVFVNKNKYTIEGLDYYRVTQTLGIIAKHRLRNWAASVGKKQMNKIMETRQAIGSHVHSIYEHHLKGDKINISIYEDEIQEDYRLFKLFVEAAGLKPDALEQYLWSKKYHYAGTADYIGQYHSPKKGYYIKGKKRITKFLVRGHNPKFKKSALVIGDWKTSKDIYPQYWLQLAAYAYAFYELTGIKVAGGFIAQARNGRFRIKEKTWDELMLEFEAYKGVLKVYEWKYKLGQFEGMSR